MIAPPTVGPLWGSEIQPEPRSKPPDSRMVDRVCRSCFVPRRCRLQIVLRSKRCRLHPSVAVTSRMEQGMLDRVCRSCFDPRRCAGAKVREGARGKSEGAEMLRTPAFNEKKTCQNVRHLTNSKIGRRQNAAHTDTPRKREPRTPIFPREDGTKVLCTPAMPDFPQNACIGVPSGCPH